MGQTAVWTVRRAEGSHEMQHGVADKAGPRKLEVSEMNIFEEIGDVLRAILNAILNLFEPILELFGIDIDVDED